MAHCRYHCASCDRCFASIRAFEAHRLVTLGACLEPADVVTRAGEPRLAATPGHCRQADGVGANARVWTVAGRAEQVAQRVRYRRVLS